jgi:hypothetical protein
LIKSVFHYFICLYSCNYLGSAEATRLANTWISAIISNPEKDLQVKLAFSVVVSVADPDPSVP